MLNRDLLQKKKLPSKGKDLNEILMAKKPENFFIEGKDSIEKFFNRKCERYKKFIQMKRDINIKRIQEDFLILEKRGIEDIEFQKERKIAQFEEALELRALNKKLKLKNAEKLISGGTLSLNEDSDGELDMICEGASKIF